MMMRRRALGLGGRWIQEGAILVVASSSPSWNWSVTGGEGVAGQGDFAALALSKVIK